MQVLLNGRASSLSHGTAAYVTQDDVLIGSLTVLECIMFVARLRLPSSVSNAERQAKVNDILSEMGLLVCKDTIIGTWPAKGISGESAQLSHNHPHRFRLTESLLLDSTSADSLFWHSRLST